MGRDGEDGARRGEARDCRRVRAMRGGAGRGGAGRARQNTQTGPGSGRAKGRRGWGRGGPVAATRPPPPPPPARAPRWTARVRCPRQSTPPKPHRRLIMHACALPASAGRRGAAGGGGGRGEGAPKRRPEAGDLHDDPEREFGKGTGQGQLQKSLTVTNGRMDSKSQF
ncbi:hypothetical protein R5R35_004007 [Gryllus longicercus]|uniref:Uncharacterized protein n=1 Tax=Gryllus longicercus TaxID=2509291 RepID=A0AAN9YUL1_9ORTH